MFAHVVERDGAFYLRRPCLIGWQMWEDHGPGGYWWNDYPELATPFRSADEAREAYARSKRAARLHVHGKFAGWL